MGHKALSEAPGRGGELVEPAYTNRATEHVHAKVGGGRQTHSHDDAKPGHGHPSQGLLPTPAGKSESYDDLGELCGWYRDEKRHWSAAEREEAIKRGWSLPDGTYPIKTRNDLQAALTLFQSGHGATPSARAHIVKRALAIGATDMLPEDMQPAKAFFLDWRFDTKAATSEEMEELGLEPGTLVLTGYANTWDLDRDGEVTAKSAFDHSLAEYMANPQVLWAHKENHEIGSVVEARTDRKGLWVKAVVPPPPPGSPSWHVKVYHDIKRRILRAFSMGGVFHRSKSIKGLIERVSLYEISVVGVPANQCSLFALAQTKELRFADREENAAVQVYRAAVEGKRRTQQPGVGRGHGRHHHGPLGPRGQGSRHRHAGGSRAHVHGLHGHENFRRQHQHGIAPLMHTHAGAGHMKQSDQDRALQDHYNVAPEAVPALRKYATENKLDPAYLTGEQVRSAIGDAGGYLPEQRGGPKAAALQSGDADEEEEEEETTETPVDELLEALSQAVDDVEDNDDMSDVEKVEAVEQLLSDFRDEASQRLARGGEDQPEDEPAKAWVLAYTGQKDVAAARHLEYALRRKEIGMDPEDQNGGTGGAGGGGDGGGTGTATAPASTRRGKAAGSGADEVTISRAEWDDVQSIVGEAKAAKLEAKAREEAAKIVEQEAKAAQEAETKRAQEREDFKSMVQEAVAELRAQAGGALVTAGHKFREPIGDGKGTPGGTTAQTDGTKGYGKRGFKRWLKDMVDRKQGNWEAYKRLQDAHQKAAEFYATDEDGEVDQKALAEATSGSGGFLVPPQYWQAGIAEFRLAAAKVRRLVDVMTVGTNLVYIPRETGIATAAWVAENAAKPSQDQTFGQIAVNVFTLAAISKVSNQLLDDSAPSADGLVRKDLGRVLGQAEDIAYINGDGNGKPTGILNTAGVLTVAYSAPAAGSGLGDAISAAMTAIDSNFFAMPTAILAHPRIIAKLRTVKDGQGRYIFEAGWTPGLGPWMGGAAAFLAGGVGAIPGFGPDAARSSGLGPVGSVWGLPVYSDANIPTNLGPGANESPLIVGVWEEAIILERQGVTVDVSNEAGTSFEQNQTWFRGEQRVGFTAARQPTAFCYVTGLTNAIAG